MSVEFDQYKFENKIRAMVLDLISPTTRRMVDFQESLEEVIRHDNQHRKRLDTLDFNFATIQGKMALIDEVHKTAQDLKSGNITFEAEISSKMQQMSYTIDRSTHKVDDMSMKIITLEENFRSSRTEISEYANTVNVIKDSIIIEHKKLVRFVEKSVAEVRKLWETAEPRLEKSEYAVLAFTDNALPRMLADVENNSRGLKEFKQIVTDTLQSKFSAEEFIKFQKSVRYEHEKIYESIKQVNENHGKIEEYLDNYLPIERWNYISEAICMLDPKHLRKFIEHDEVKINELRDRVEQEHLDIEGMSRKALECYDYSATRREVMKIEIEKAELEEKASLNKARKSKSRRKHGSSKESKRKRRNSPHEHEEEHSDHTFPEPPKPEEEKSAVESHPLLPEIKSQTVIQEQPKEVIIEIPVEPPSDPLASTLNLIPQDSEPSISHEDSEFNDFDNTISPSPFQENVFPNIDITQFETKLEELRQNLDQVSLNFATLTESSETFTKSTEERLQQFQQSLLNTQQDLETNLNLMHEEIKQIVLRNKQDKTDVNKQFSLQHTEIRGSSEIVERLDQQFSTLNELLITLSEMGKILHLLTLQEEDDRQSLQLLGYTESKSQKAYISLKSDCMSCSGQNPVLMSAFKMACLNYSPSNVKYKHKTYSRKQLINVLGTVANSAWAQACSKAPRYATDFGTYPSIPTLSEDSVHNAGKKHRYNRSQFIELPSLNTSKYLLDIGETPVSSTKTLKK